MDWLSDPSAWTALAARFGKELEHERLVDVRHPHTVVDEVEQLLEGHGSTDISTA
jgi:hypothetical protein